MRRHGGRMLLSALLGVALVPLAMGQDSVPLPMPTPAKTPAVMKMILPATSTVWIENMKMVTTGPLRLFQSPPLDPDKAYIYRVKVSWPTQPGKPDFVMEQEVTVKAGQTTTVDFSPVAKLMPSQPTPPVQQAGYVQPPTNNPPTYTQPPGRLPARRQYPGRGGY